jgi:hypothetical protein
MNTDRRREKKLNRKKYLTLAIVVTLVAQAFLASGAYAPRGPRKQWTYMIYVCGDNDLEYLWDDLTLPWIGSVGSSDQVNFVALVDRLSTNTVELVYINDQNGTVLEVWEEQNMGSVTTLVKFINRVTTLFPAKKLVLDFWDHGGAWKYFMRDQTADDSLDLSELRQALEEAGVHFDIIAFNACSMAMADVFCEIIGYADYVVASEELASLLGFPYELYTRDLIDNPTWDAERFAIEMVVDWAEFYDALDPNDRVLDQALGASWGTLSAIDVDQMATLTTAFTDMASAMLANLPQYKKDYTHAASASEQMSNTFLYLDLYDFAKTLLEDTTVTDPVLRKALDDIKAIIDSMVVAYDNGIVHSDCHGVTFYFPIQEWTGPWTVREDYLQVEFAQVTGWITFLDAYHGIE